METGLRSEPDQAGKAAPVSLPEHEDVPATGQVVQKAESRPFEVPSEGGEFKRPVCPGQPIEA